jgi:hypothetical protein
VDNRGTDDLQIEMARGQQREPEEKVTQSLKILTHQMMPAIK